MADARVAVRIPVQPWFADHRFDGRVILPAVEAMAVLARAARQHAPALDVQCLADARFDRLLAIEPVQEAIEATVELEETGEGLIARLLTRRQLAAMARMVAHCELRFGGKWTEAPGETAPLLTEPLFTVDTRRLYAELVPFGPAYRSLQGELRVGPEGAEGELLAPLLPDANPGSGLLGSPFPLDGAMHAACVHGQRLADFVPFPVGFDRRHIFNPTEPGGGYRAQVRLRLQAREMLVYDLLITGADARVRERITGLRMRDVSGGRIRPPEWIRAEAG